MQLCGCSAPGFGHLPALKAAVGLTPSTPWTHGSNCGGLRPYTFYTLDTCELRRLTVLHLLHAGHLPALEATVGLPPYPHRSRDCIPQPRHHRANSPRARMRFSRCHDFWVSLQPRGLPSGAPWTPKGARGGCRSYTFYTLDTWGHTRWPPVLHLIHFGHAISRVVAAGLTHLTP